MERAVVQEARGKCYTVLQSKKDLSWGRGEVEESGKQKKRKKSEPTGVGTTGLYSKINVTGCGWAGQGFAT